MHDIHEIQASALTALGMVLLASSVFGVRKVILIANAKQRWLWRGVLGLLTFFLCAYAAFIVGLIFGVPICSELLAGFVFLFGAVFALGVVRASVVSMAELVRVGNLAYTDALTGLFNRRHADERLAEEIERSERYRRPLSVLLIDVDHFKQINDTYGHKHGDIVLQDIARLLIECFRCTDVACRYGGEEFLVVLPETKELDACTAAERFRKSVAAHRFELPLLQAVRSSRVSGTFQTWHQVTVSLGVVGLAESPRAAARGDLVCLADQALYASKREGRNRVTRCTAAA